MRIMRSSDRAIVIVPGTSREQRRMPPSAEPSERWQVSDHTLIGMITYV